MISLWGHLRCSETPLQPLQLGMDADLQHEPESVPDVAKPVLEGRDGSAI
jgi:hypothetical protein